MKKIKVLHLFDNYPGSNSQNWLYKLIVNTPGTSVHIASERYTKHNLYSNTFNYFSNPLETLIIHKNSVPPKLKYLPRKLFLAVIKRLLGNYKEYLNRFISDSDFDVVHAHFAHVGCEYMDIVKNRNIPLVVSFYGYDYEYLPFTKPEYKKAYQQLFKKADKFICEGKHGKSILKNMGCAENKIEIVHLGVEPQKIPFNKKTKKAGSLKLLQIANLVEKKGHIYTLRAFHKALEHCPDMHLTIVGNGMDIIKSELKNYIAANKLAEKISMINEIDYHLLYSFMADYDVFIHPSCYSDSMDCEGGAPVVLLDAQATGMPVISTTHCDIPDEVLNGVTGLLSPEKDVEALAESIRKFYDIDEITFADYSLAARKHIEDYFDITKNAVRNYEIYKSILN